MILMGVGIRAQAMIRLNVVGSEMALTRSPFEPKKVNVQIVRKRAEQLQQQPTVQSLLAWCPRSNLR